MAISFDSDKFECEEDSVCTITGSLEGLGEGEIQSSFTVVIVADSSIDDDGSGDGLTSELYYTYYTIHKVHACMYSSYSFCFTYINVYNTVCIKQICM